jgi:hypothetical protein
MTVCIATICNKGKSVVVAADRMVSWPAGDIIYQWDGHNKKIEYLTKNSVLMWAGSEGSYCEIISKCKKSVEADFSIAQVAEKVEAIYNEQRIKQAERLVLFPRGLSLEKFHRSAVKNMPDSLFKELDTALWRYEFKLWLLVAGVDKEGAHIELISDKFRSNVNRNVFHVIGTGAFAALPVLGQKSTYAMSISEAKALVRKAAETAQLISGVGECHDLFALPEESEYSE